MNVGILTFHWAYNYGALLQAYALYETVTNLGHAVKFIDYAPPGQRGVWYKGWGLLSGPRVLPWTLRRLRFDSFRKRFLPMTKRCDSKADLRKMARDFDAVIVGSDQVWNSDIYQAFDPSYFLDFVYKPRCRLISYAACFGDPIQPQEMKNQARPLLHRFDHLSVRNEMSAKLVSDIAGREAEVVVDPTFLHDFKECLTSNASAQEYIAAYFLSTNHLALSGKALQITKQRIGLPVVSIGLARDVSCVDREILSAGPLQWLRILKGGSFVFTESLHGIAFSMKFKKPFVVRTGWNPARIQEILKTYALESRLLINDDETLILRALDTPIDYDAVIERLPLHIHRSIDFLKKALKP